MRHAPDDGRRGQRAAAPEGPEAPPDGRTGERHAFFSALLTGVLAPLNSTMIVVALPAVLADLEADLTWGSWIIVSYLVAMAAVQPLGGSLGDRLGRRRLMLFGLAGFALASLLAAFAWRVEVLVLARSLQAVTGASAIPNGTALVRTLVSSERQGRAFGMLGAGLSVAAALGPPLGGIVTDALGWRWLFALNLLVLLPALALVWRLPAPASARPRSSFDLLGSALLLLTLLGAAAALTLWRLPGIPLALAPALALGAALAGWWFVRHARHRPDPVLHVTLLGRRGFLAAGVAVASSNLVMYAAFVALPLFLAQLVGWGTREVGWAVAAMSLAMLVWGPLGGAWADRSGRRRPAVTGAAVALVATASFAAIAPGWPWWAFAGLLVTLGTGIGLANAAIQTAAMQAAGAAEAGQAAGLFSTLRYTGSIIGTAGLAAVLGDASEVAAFRVLFALVALVAVAAVVSTARLPAR